jgi:hypothetical protein
MDHQNSHVDSTSDNYTKNTSDNFDETPTVNSVNPNYHPSSSTSASWETNHPVVDSLANKGKTELKKGQQQAEDIITKTKKLFKQHCKLY